MPGHRVLLLPATLLAGCSLFAHAPTLEDPTCVRVDNSVTLDVVGAVGSVVLGAALGFLVTLGPCNTEYEDCRGAKSEARRWLTVGLVGSAVFTGSAVSGSSARVQIDAACDAWEAARRDDPPADAR